MPTPTLVGSPLLATTGASSSTTTSAPLPTAVQAGDLAVWVTAAERTLVPTSAVTTSSGASRASTTVAAGTAGGGMAYELAWARLVAADVGGSVTASASIARRMTISGYVLRGALDPVFQVGSEQVLLAAERARTSPSITPTVGDSMLLAFLAATNSVSPYDRVFDVSGTGWVRGGVGASTSTASNNAFAIGASRVLTGGAGAGQDGATFTDTQAKWIGVLATVAVGAPEATTPIPGDPGTGTTSWLTVPPGFSRLELLTR